jgi:hypothetical protein
VAVAACASAAVAPEERAVNEIWWSAATYCAGTTGTITVNDIDSFGRIHYTLSQGGKQDVPRFEACYVKQAREELAKRPDLQEYLRQKQESKK